jgi:hypothetical protein
MSDPIPPDGPTGARGPDRPGDEPAIPAERESHAPTTAWSLPGSARPSARSAPPQRETDPHGPQWHEQPAAASWDRQRQPPDPGQRQPEGLTVWPQAGWGAGVTSS